MSEAILRLATLDDVLDIETLIRGSIREIFPTTYSVEQTSSAISHVGDVDTQLVQDGTYFVIEEAGELIACGGWSRRDKLYTGSGAHEGDVRLLDPAAEPARVRAMFTRSDRTRRGHGMTILLACEDAARAEGFQTLTLGATLPGIPLYERFGFTIAERTEFVMPDGIALDGATMTRPVTNPLSRPPRNRTATTD